MTEKKETKAKAEAKPKAKAKANDDARPVQLTLRDSYGVIVLHGSIVMYGKPNGLQMLGRGHRVTGSYENLITLESTCENRELAKKVYLDNGWTE